MSAESTKTLPSERGQHLLKVLIQRYIQDGQPVGSRTLSKDSGLELSPATIRNVMSDLEEMGLVSAPHTSAGRVPTPQGYRLFVDTLVRYRQPGDGDIQRIQHKIKQEFDTTGALVSTVSSMLSDVTRMAGVVSVPRAPKLTLRQIEFLPLSEKRVLVILVINDREVQNRIVHTRRDYTRAQLEQAANYLNATCSGTDLRQAREQLLGEMRLARESMSQIMLAAIEMADKAFTSREEGDDYVMAGQTNLMGIEDLGDMEKLRQLFDAFNEKQQILHLLDGALHANGIQIFIGEESGYEVLDECSVVTAPYEVNGQLVGVLGVIGPTRMAYERVIPIVDLTAKLLGSVLNQRQ